MTNTVTAVGIIMDAASDDDDDELDVQSYYYQSVTDTGITRQRGPSC